MLRHDPRTHRSAQKRLMMRVTVKGRERLLHILPEQPDATKVHAQDRRGKSVVLDADAIQRVIVDFDFSQEDVRQFGWAG